MAFIPIENCAKVAVVQHVVGMLCINTLHFQKASAITTTDMGILAQGVVDWWSDYLAPILNSGISLDTIEVTDLTSESSPAIELAVEVPVVGALTGPMAPMNVAAVVTFNTEQRGRSYRGRNYVCGIDMDNTTNAGYLASAFQAALLSAYSQIEEIEVAAGMWHVVASRYADKAPRSAGVTTTVTGYSVDGNLDSQRRRLPGRGE